MIFLHRGVSPWDARRRGRPPHHAGDGGLQALWLQPGGLEHLGGHPFALTGQAQQQVLRAHVAVAQLTGCLLGKPQGLLRPGRKFVLIHSVLPSFPWESPVYLFSFCSL